MTKINNQNQSPEEMRSPKGQEIIFETILISVSEKVTPVWPCKARARGYENVIIREPERRKLKI